MNNTTSLKCACGQTQLEVTGSPIASVECCCTSCREASVRMRALDGAPDFLSEHGTTPFVMYRKDRVRFIGGEDTLKAFRLSAKASTRRAVATCCNTPVFLEFESGHWLSLYTEIWPDGTQPSPESRTMAADFPDGTDLPDDIPNAKKHSLGFFAKLLGAWIAMGFRVPKIIVTEDLDA